MAFNMVKFFNMPFASVVRVRRLQLLASVMKISTFSDEDETERLNIYANSIVWGSAALSAI